jgi:hypothetical protein
MWSERTLPPLDQREHHFLADAADMVGVALGAVLGLFLAAHIGFVGFHRLAFAADGIGAGFAKALADAMAEEPRRLVGHADHAADLKRAHALLARHHQMRGAQPFVQRHMRALIERPDRDREGLATGVALIEAGAVALALHGRGLANDAALRADRPFRPQPSFKPCAGLVLVVEDGVGKIVVAHSPPHLLRRYYH